MTNSTVDRLRDSPSMCRYVLTLLLHGPLRARRSVKMRQKSELVLVVGESSEKQI